MWEFGNHRIVGANSISICQRNCTLSLRLFYSNSSILAFTFSHSTSLRQIPFQFHNMPFQQKEFTTPPPIPAPGTPRDSASAQPWYSVGAGIWELLLNGDPDHKAVLQWWEPNTTTSNQPITHTFIEEVCFLRGGLEDLTLQQAWGIGAYAYRKPGMEHGPYRASEEGCLMFVKVVPASNE